MTEISRRTLLASAAGTAALGLSGSLSFIPAAIAADVKKKGFYSYKIGDDIEVFSIYDGLWQKAHDASFIPGVTIDETKAALRAAGETDEFVEIDFAFNVVKTGGKTIMIDSGTGAQLAPTAGLAAKGLEAAGIKTEDVNTILISHMHPDHIFGLMAPDTNAQTYPNAEIKVAEKEYKFWTDPATLAALPDIRKPLAQRIQATFPNWDNVTLFDGEVEVEPGIQAVATHGHTPGHTAFRVASGSDQVLVIGDLLIVPSLFLSNLDWQLVFDSDKDQATATRKSIVDQAVSDGLLLSGYHFGFPNSGKIEKDGSSFVFNPVSA